MHAEGRPDPPAVIDDPPGGPTRVVTFAELNDGEQLADYKKPRSVEFRDEFPRDEAGKIRKRDLREPFWAGRATRV